MEENELLFLFYCPPLGRDPEQDGDRWVSLVHAVETALGESLTFTITKWAKRKAVADRDEWVRSLLREGKLPLNCNDGYEGAYVSISGLPLLEPIGPAKEAALLLHLETPGSEPFLAKAATVIGAAGDALSAYWGYVSPKAASLAIVDQVDIPEQPSPSTILPKVRQPMSLRSHSIPLFVAWLNYWARDTVAAVGYSAAEDNGTIFASTREVGNGGLVLQLTDDPLDLSRPEHLAALQNAYRRLPAIGGRDTMP